MGTTLTGTTPQDTYDSLIKVTDNGPLSGTAKYLSDGLGNDSVLALSTSRIAIGSTVDSGELITAYGSAEAAIVFQNSNSGTGSGQGLYLGTLNAENYLWTYENQPLIVATNNTERLRITSAGNVGIGTSSPLAKLDVRGTTYLTSTGADGTLADAVIFGNSNYPNTQSNRIRTSTSASADLNRISIEAGNGTAGQYINEQLMLTGNGYVRLGSGTGGLQFNGDTAAANALDDYEEGTFTPVFRGATSAGSYTFALGGGSYTKIGNQVTVWITLIDIAESSAGSGDWQIGGLPFTSRNSSDLARVATACWIRSSAAARNNIICGVFNNSSNISFLYDANGSGAGNNFTIASDFLTNMDIGLQVTYYV